MDRLKRRSDFLNAARGYKQVRSAIVLQACQSRGGGRASFPARIGFTLTKRLGGAVVRNRIRRRLKEAVRLLECEERHQDKGLFLSGTDYVVIGRAAALDAPFSHIQKDLRSALLKIARHIQKPEIRRTQNNLPPDTGSTGQRLIWSRAI